MKCIECNRVLQSMGFGYFMHPSLLDHFQRVKADEYQCSKVGEIRKMY